SSGATSTHRSRWRARPRQSTPARHRPPAPSAGRASPPPALPPSASAIPTTSPPPPTPPPTSPPSTPRTTRRPPTRPTPPPRAAAGTLVRGHEFHHSTIEPCGDAFELSGRFGAGAAGFASPSLLASYVHVHLAADPALAERFVATATPAHPR